MRLVQIAAPVAEPEPYEPEPKTQRNSTGLMISGIVLGGVGATIAAVGSLSLLSYKDCSGLDGESLAACEHSEDDEKARGRRVFLVGAAIAVVGVPLIVIGARRVPVEHTLGQRQSNAETRRVALVVSGSGLSLRGEF
jgi:hypothetical protein